MPKTGRPVFIKANHTLKCYSCFLNSRKLCFCHDSQLKTNTYHHNQPPNLLLCCIIPRAVDAKKDWLRSSVGLLWVWGSSNTFEENSKTQRTEILHVYSKCFKWIWLLFIFLITGHYFLIWLCFLLKETALWSLLMSNMSCLLIKIYMEDLVKEEKGR